MRISEAFPTKWLSAPDLQGKEFTLQIARISMESVGEESGEQKPVLWFHGTQKGLVLNKTNAEAISIVYGDDTDQWLNQKLAVYTVHTEYKGKPVLGIRVRAQPAPLPAAPAPPTPAAAPALDTTLASLQAARSENPGAGLPQSVEDDEIPF